MSLSTGWISVRWAFEWIGPDITIHGPRSPSHYIPDPHRRRSAVPGCPLAEPSAITDWALEWLAGLDNQRSTTSSTPLAHPLHLRPPSAATCSGRSGTAFRSVCAITAWALERPAGPDNQRSTPPSTPLAHPRISQRHRLGPFYGYMRCDKFVHPPARTTACRGIRPGTALRPTSPNCSPVS